MRPYLLIAAVSLAPFALTAPATAQQLDDEAVAKLVVREVVSYPQFSIFDDINVGVTDGEVTVSGRVTMPFKRDAIVERISAIEGVRDVVNRIEVLPASLSDTRLRRQVAQAIYTHPSFWHYGSMANPPIHIIVERGRIRLTGTVNSQTDRMLAYALAQVDGALGVTNELKLDR